MYKYKKEKSKYKYRISIGILWIGLIYLILIEDKTIGQDIEDINPKVLEEYKINNQIIILNQDNLNNININCTRPTIEEFPPDLFNQEQRKNGLIIIHFLVSIYIFYGIALVCDDYFVPSIESICKGFHIPSDVGGATFMAIATSAPELFTNIIGTFVTHGDIGVGTIVGSAVFNILAVCACCGLATENILQLDWWSLSRDCFFYSISVILLLIVLINRKIFWYEALSLVSLYFIYIIVMYYNSSCKKLAERIIYGIFGKRRKISNIHQNNENIHIKDENEKSPLIHKVSSECEFINDEVDLFNEKDELLISQALHQTEIEAEEEKIEWGIFNLPYGEGILKWIEWIIGWPPRFCFVFTIPDCREHKYKKLYPITFIMCIIWIALLTYVMTWMMTIIGYTIGVPDSVMGLTFIAAGTSVPEAVSSIIVTKQGLGSMGISNSIGSNTFDILICLGLPWLIRCLILNSNGIGINYIEILSGGLEYSTILLITSVLLLYILLASNSFILNKKIGIIALIMYGLFLIISSLFELNVFFNVNLPTCN